LKINFIDLQRQYQQYKTEIDEAIESVLQSSRYVFGEEIGILEKKLCEYIGVKNAVACANGSDAILLALIALGLKTGDEIITTPFTFIATSEMPALLGIKPVYADIDPKTYNIDPQKIETLITDKTKAIMPVSLYGQLSDMDEIIKIADKHNLFVIEDGAQSFGAEYKGRKSCSFKHISTTSFFPAKPLGCYGEGGMVFTDDDNLSDKMKSIRNHGQGEKYEHKYIGLNARMDTIQAAVLLAKFVHYENEIALRQEKAQYYSNALKDLVTIPYIKEGNKSVFAQYTIQTQKRDKLIKHLSEKNIPHAIHYPKPLHLQPCFSSYGYKKGDLPVCEKVSDNVLSLPMHPFLLKEEQDYVINGIKEGLGN
jgi:UDP-2-acetamido-2-deoxy-ribo-hexuluronate aminotransferase